MYEKNNVMVENIENVARALFSPKMIINGTLQPEAFKLRSTISENYLSVMRMIFPTWKEDILTIPQRKNRVLYGHAVLNVGGIRNISLNDIKFDVKECSENSKPSHAGIFITVHGENLIGGQLLKLEYSFFFTNFPKTLSCNY